MKTLSIVLMCMLAAGCATQRITHPGHVAGTQLTVFLSDPVVCHGDASAVVFELKNITNVTVSVPIDTLQGYHVRPGLDMSQDKQVGPVYGTLLTMPGWYYRTLKPGETMSHSLSVFTVPAQPTRVGNGIMFSSPVDDPMAIRFLLPGEYKIGISEGRGRPCFATFDLKVKRGNGNPTSASMVAEPAAGSPP
jgi:hypothetical protein